MIKPLKKLTHLKKEFAQTMVEFALVFPIVLLITYGIIEVGRMVFIYAGVTSSAREGARFGAAAGGTVDNSITPKFAQCANIRDAVRQTAFLINIPDADIQIWYDRGPGSSIVANNCPPPYSFGQYPIKNGDRIIVHVTAHYAPVISLLGFNGFDITKENARTILTKININP
ncbi:MAG: hypothetical protein A2Y53_01540 [Chloroflexi bacterium RBG_16_47_49]|nr:MAG: hypothetical protein A2Y53_01540 [Chloroflexi bacterium RBG_16_47_49]